MTITAPSDVADDIDKDKILQSELEEISACLKEVREKTGYGVLVIEIQRGGVYEITVSYKRRMKKDIIKSISK